MRSITTRRLALPLALACLCAAQAVSAGRSLSAVGPKNIINPNTYQWVQLSVSIRGKTCAGLPNIDAQFRTAFKSDVTRTLSRATNGAAAIPSIGDNGLNKPCEDKTYKGVNYAGVRAALRFRFLNTTLPRDFLFDSARESTCRGGYRKEVYPAVAKLMADNGLTVSFNNGSRTNPAQKQNTGWVWNVDPVRCDRTAVASPSPTPLPSPSPAALPSPSPAQQLPSPSPAPQLPSPSPAPAPCTTIPNSETAADGTCVCTKPGFTLRGLDGDKLVSCLPSSTTVCPAPTSTAVKDNSTPVPKILSCITPATPCPTGYTFPLYAGTTRAECRIPVVDCTYTPYTMRIEDASGAIIGCVNPSFNQCPFVAFRSYTRNYQIDACKKVDACPAYVGTANPPVTTYTTAARAADRSLQACLTLNTDNVCPMDVPNADYPIEAVLGNPTGCGSNALQCSFAAPNPTRVVECLAVGAACDAAQFPVQIFKMVGAGAIRPSLVQCRQARPSGICDLTLTGMGGIVNDQNAGPYTINVFQTQGNLVGCLMPTGQLNQLCPSSYPVAVYDAGTLKECRPATDSPNPCRGNTAQPVPAMSANGTWLGICLARTATCLGNYANQYGTPVTIRNDFGEMIQCREQVAACPTTPQLNTDGTTFVTPSFPLYRPGTDGKTVITSCYPPTAVGSTCSLTTDLNTQYSKPIRSNNTANAPLLGCMSTTATSCPADYPFAVMQGNNLLTCAPAGDLVTCPAGFTPATRGSGTLIGCLDLSGQNPKVCPSAYPTTIAVGINQDALECMAEESRCYKPTQPFWLFEEIGPVGAKYLELKWCINPQESITDCAQSTPAQGNAAWSDAAEVYNNVGTSITGCIKRPTPGTAGSLTTCPVEAPFIFKDLLGATFQCRQSIAPATSCAAAVAGATAPNGIGNYTVNVLNGTALVGCTVTGGSTCPIGGVLVSQTAYTTTELCLADSLTSCTGVKNQAGDDRSFPLFSGVNTDGTPKLVRCIAPVIATDCSNSAVNSQSGQPKYNVPMYSNNVGSGNVIGCVRQSSEVPTPCPAAAPFYLVEAGATSALAACIQKPAGCNITSPVAWAPYTLPLYNADASVLLGCMAQITPTLQCPSTAAGSPYSVPFAIRSANGAIIECRLQALNAVTSCAAYAPATVPIINSNITGAIAPVIGCAVPGTGAAGFPAPCLVPGYPVAFYDAAGVLVQCRSAATACDPAGSGGFDVRYTNGINGVLEACVDITASRRRQLLGTGNTPGSGSNGCFGTDRLAFWSSSTVLVECARGANLTTCNSLSSPYTSYTTELSYNFFNKGVTLEGCLAGTTCPNNKFIAPLNANVTYPYKVTQNLTEPVCFEQSACAASPCGANATYATCAASTNLPGFACTCTNNTCTTASVIISFTSLGCVTPQNSSSGSLASAVPCVGDASQTWVTEGGLVKLLGTNRCLTAVAGAAADVTVSTCVNGTTSQGWSYNSNAQLQSNANSTYCLQDSGNKLVTAPCGNSTSQQFWMNL